MRRCTLRRACDCWPQHTRHTSCPDDCLSARTTRCGSLLRRGVTGEPGGSALVQVKSAGATLEWCCSTYLPSPKSTNNIAEVRGLLEGFRQAWWQGVPRLAAVGDSALILGWLERRQPPRAAHLRRAYGHARHFADRIRIDGWYHHYRAANKTADRLANEAMDNQHSSTLRRCADAQYQARSHLWDELTATMETDLEPWRARARRGDRSTMTA